MSAPRDFLGASETRVLLRGTQSPPGSSLTSPGTHAHTRTKEGPHRKYVLDPGAQSHTPCQKLCFHMGFGSGRMLFERL